MPNQISIWSIHELCFGVKTNCIRWEGLCRKSAQLFMFLRIPLFLFPSVLNPCCLLGPYLPVLLQLLRSSLLYVWDLSMAFPCSLLQCQKTIRLVMPWRIYSNSIFAHCSGRGSLSGYLYSNACTPVILSVEMTWLPSWPDSYAGFSAFSVE